MERERERDRVEGFCVFERSYGRVLTTLNHFLVPDVDPRTLEHAKKGDQTERRFVTIRAAFSFPPQ